MRYQVLGESRLINPRLLSAIAGLKHTECLAVCDPGLPLPEHADIIDLSLIPGVPGFLVTLESVLEELVVEGCVIAAEMEERSGKLYDGVRKIMKETPERRVSHEEFKQLCQRVKTFVVTGETTPYANIILTGGVPF